MAALTRSQRSKLESNVRAARKVAEAAARKLVMRIAVGRPSPASAMSEADRDIRRRLRAAGRSLGDGIDPKTGNQETARLVEEIAFFCWHRVLFERFLIENGLSSIPSRLPNTEHTNVFSSSFTELPGSVHPLSQGANSAEALLHEILACDPVITELQLDTASQVELQRLADSLPHDIFLASDSVGWTYQFWQSHRKEAIIKSEVKIGGSELPAVTQLFTDAYLVDFVLDNTLGAWHAGKVLAANPELARGASNETDLRSAVAIPGCSWEYLRFTNDSSRWHPAAGCFQGWPKAAREIKCLDPSMGSGLFLIGLLDRLAALRSLEEGLSRSEARLSVLRDNLFGLDIDPRCTRVAWFNVSLHVWKQIGVQPLPLRHLTCSGTPPTSTEKRWLRAVRSHEVTSRKITQFRRQAEQCQLLGSLLDPLTVLSDPDQGVEQSAVLAIPSIVSVELESSVSASLKDDAMRAAFAQSLEILSSHYTLVVTNVPYLGRRKQGEWLKEFCAQYYSEAKGELATCFMERCLRLCKEGATCAVLMPQNWLFLKSFAAAREKLLNEVDWNLVVRLGAKAFQSPTYDFGVSIHCFNNSPPRQLASFVGFDAGSYTSPEDKAEYLRNGELERAHQHRQLENPYAAITFEEPSGLPLLEEYADSFQGSGLADIERFRRYFWELPGFTCGWVPHQSSPTGTEIYSGFRYAVRWENGTGSLIKAENATIRGRSAFGRRGVACAWLGRLPVGMFLGTFFDNSIAAIIPKDPVNLLPVWCFLSSQEFVREVRKLNQKAQVANATLVKVPFDLERWRGIAEREFPTGMPVPFSEDPTQWLYDGDVLCTSQGLHVVVAQWLGYRWPRQYFASIAGLSPVSTPNSVAQSVEDGIACLPSVRGNLTASENLLKVLEMTYGDRVDFALDRLLPPNCGTLQQRLENWLRNDFFREHLDLFEHRPFIWHVWDGLPDGFAALLNYHMLDRSNLDRLISIYLQEWIDLQSKGQDADAVRKHRAAIQLRNTLLAILEGEAPHDIFVRWKPIHEQSIGWEPDLSDGVRLNIRPFVTCPGSYRTGTGVLRVRPKVHWKKDRGKEELRDKEDYPWLWSQQKDVTADSSEAVFHNERVNDCHLTLEQKKLARIAAEGIRDV